MKAVLKKNQGDIFVIELKGEVDSESAEPFYQTCMSKLSRKNLIFNLKNLHFVGSDGLNLFVNTIRDLKQESSLQFCCVGSEFRKVFADSEIKDIAIHEDEQSAISTIKDKMESF